MGKKLTGKALAKFEAERDVWQEVPAQALGRRKDPPEDRRVSS